MMIELTHVSKRYPDGTTAVTDFSGQFPAHQTTVLVGSSGCGKTTLLRMINRLVEPSAGEITIDGVDVADQDPVELRRSIGYVMQQVGLLPHQFVIDNISTVPRLNGVSKAEANQRAEELMQLVGLDPDLARRYPNQLSGGQQQRVGVARALAADPNILLMDEPFGAVDPLVRRDLQDELLRLQAELGKTVVFVTHDINEALLLGEQIILMREGGVVAQRGTPSELLADPADEFVQRFLGLDRGERLLHTEEGTRRTLLVDEAGRPVGVLAPESSP